MKEAEAMDNWLEVSEHFMVNKLVVKTSVILTEKPFQVVILYHFTWQPEKVYLCSQWSREKSKKVLKTYSNVSIYNHKPLITSHCRKAKGWTVNYINSCSSPYSGPVLSSFAFCGLAFHGFSYPRSTVVWKYQMENSRKKWFISFKLHTAVLINMMKSHTSSPQDMSHLFVHCIPAHWSPSGSLGHQTDCHGIAVLVFKWPTAQA